MKKIIIIFAGIVFFNLLTNTILAKNIYLTYQDSVPNFTDYPVSTNSKIVIHNGPRHYLLPAETHHSEKTDPEYGAPEARLASDNNSKGNKLAIVTKNTGQKEDKNYLEIPISRGSIFNYIKDVFNYYKNINYALKTKDYSVFGAESEARDSNNAPAPELQNIPENQKIEEIVDNNGSIVFSNL